MMYRNKNLLEAAKDAPVCFGCQRTNMGDVVAAHSNQLRDGKGRGLKADDFRVAFICASCNHELDQGVKWSRAERVAFWEEAHRHTVGWLFKSGRLNVVQIKGGM